MGNSNKGLLGVESIRLGGTDINYLPMAEAAITKQQWPKIIEESKKQEADNIIAQYPKTTIRYCESRIVECELNIERIRQLKSDQNKMINDYSAQVSLCEFRDVQVAKLDADKDKAEIAKLKLDFPAYDIEAMNQQIVQCREAIVRSDEVIDREHKSVSELKDTISKLEVRDEKLKVYGVIM